MGAYSFVDFIKADSLESAMSQWKRRMGFDRYDNSPEYEDESYDDNYEMKARGYQEMKVPPHVTGSGADHDSVRIWCNGVIDATEDLKWKPAHISSLGGDEYVVFGMLCE